MQLIITRPAEDASPLADALRARGHRALLLPLLEIVFNTHATCRHDNVAALAFTSANGARAMSAYIDRHAKQNLDLQNFFDAPVFAVGAQTAQAARACGWDNVFTSTGDVADLCRMIVENHNHITQKHVKEYILHSVGRHQAGDLVAQLRAHNLDAETCVLYEARAVQNFPPDIAKKLRAGAVDGVLIYSRRSGELFLDYLARFAPDASRHLRAFCLSPALAELMRARGLTAVAAPQMTQEALLDLIAESHSGNPDNPDNPDDGAACRT